jgi:regulator of protease activity HflC (stomatin/prohibitin superfamily)
MAGEVSKDGFGPDGAWAQAAELSFRFLFVLVFLLGAGWAVSNCRQVPPESRAMVLALGKVVREAGPGLLLALPQPFERVILLPSADRQIELKLTAFQPQAQRDFAQSSAAGSAPAGTAVSPDPRQNTGMLLTGDMSVVHFDATLFYQITDAHAYVLASERVQPALTRLFVASAVAVAARRDLDTILVARPELNTSSDIARVGRERLRMDLVTDVNRRLADLVRQGASLGIQVSRVDLVPSIPAEAKSDFDAVLYAVQEAQTEIARARTEAENVSQKAHQARDRLLTDVQAMAEERINQARTRTAAITALAQGVQGQSGDTLARQLYQDQVGTLLDHAGKVFTADGAGGARMIVPGGSNSGKPSAQP